MEDNFVTTHPGGVYTIQKYIIYIGNFYLLLYCNSPSSSMVGDNSTDSSVDKRSHACHKPAPCPVPSLLCFLIPKVRSL